MRESLVRSCFAKALHKLGLPQTEIFLEHPADWKFGDFSTNIALRLRGKHELYKNPRELAEQLVAVLVSDGALKKTFRTIEVAGGGFINFSYKTSWLIETATQYSKKLPAISPFHFGEQRKLMVEFAQPNTHKPFHIGHLRNIIIGESLVRLLEIAGNCVIRTNYEGDVGLHIAKCLWGLKRTGYEGSGKLPLEKRIKLLGDAYVAGNKAYEDDPEAQDEIKNLNAQIYEKNSETYAVWHQTRKWSLEYFDNIYKRVGSRFDRLFFESEVYERGLEVAQEAVEKGILEVSENAVVFNGEAYGLHARVFVTKEGNPTYEGKDLGLAELETNEFGKLDKVIHVVDMQQSSYFQVLFKVLSLIDPRRYQNVEYHFAYGFVKLKNGRMSSRKGTVILGEWLLDEAKRRIGAAFDVDELTAEAVAVGAVKYSFLKVDAKAEIAFDIDQSISLEGNSGPYLQYTYARIKSVLAKAGGKGEVENTTSIEKVRLSETELTLLRLLTRYSETVTLSARMLRPDMLCSYLYDLTKAFNSFYQSVPILTSEDLLLKYRIALTRAVGMILESGLTLLGIPVIEKM